MFQRLLKIGVDWTALHLMTAPGQTASSQFTTQTLCRHLVNVPESTCHFFNLVDKDTLVFKIDFPFTNCGPHGSDDLGSAGRVQGKHQLRFVGIFQGGRPALRPYTQMQKTFEGHTRSSQGLVRESISLQPKNVSPLIKANRFSTKVFCGAVASRSEGKA